MAHEDWSSLSKYKRDMRAGIDCFYGDILTELYYVCLIHFYCIEKSSVNTLLKYPFLFHKNSIKTEYMMTNDRE